MSKNIAWSKHSLLPQVELRVLMEPSWAVLEFELASAMHGVIKKYWRSQNVRREMIFRPMPQVWLASCLLYALDSILHCGPAHGWPERSAYLGTPWMACLEWCPTCSKLHHDCTEHQSMLNPAAWFLHHVVCAEVLRSAPWLARTSPGV